jgi:hypothetical protein
VRACSGIDTGSIRQRAGGHGRHRPGRVSHASAAIRIPVTASSALRPTPFGRTTVLRHSQTQLQVRYPAGPAAPRRIRRAAFPRDGPVPGRACAYRVRRPTSERAGPAACCRGAPTAERRPVLQISSANVRSILRK